MRTSTLVVFLTLISLPGTASALPAELCVGDTGLPCGAIAYAGCCAGNQILWCEYDVLHCYDCGLEQDMNQCGWIEEGPMYDCSATQSADPSGTYPMACPEVCLPNCADLQCGDDGCGGQCACPEGHSCDSGLCVPSVCQPACGDHACGDDGCGGSCGTCQEGAFCQNGYCEVGVCTPVCEGLQCGDDGCGSICGTCKEGEYCQDGLCYVKDCTPACTGLECGDDGCGGSCGSCSPSKTCDKGTCVATDSPQPDVTTPGDDVTPGDDITPVADTANEGADTATTGGKGSGSSGGGCSSTSDATPISVLLLAALGLALAWVRRGTSRA